MEYKDMLIKRLEDLSKDTDMLNYYQYSIENISRFTEDDIRKLFCFDREMSASFDWFLFECFRSKVICDTYKNPYNVISPYLTDYQEDYVNKADRIRSLMAYMAEYFAGLDITNSISYQYYMSYMKLYKSARCTVKSINKLDANELGFLKDVYKMTKSFIEVDKREYSQSITNEYMDLLNTMSAAGYFGIYYNILNEYYMLKLGVDNSFDDLTDLTKLVTIIKLSPANKKVKNYLENRMYSLTDAYSSAANLVERLSEDFEYVRR